MQKRPWYKKRTNKGLMILGITAILSFIPATTIIFAVGPFVVTGAALIKAVGILGAGVVGHGIGRRIEKNNGNKEE